MSPSRCAKQGFGSACVSSGRSKRAKRIKLTRSTGSGLSFSVIDTLLEGAFFDPLAELASFPSPPLAWESSPGLPPRSISTVLLCNEATRCSGRALRALP